MKKNTIKNRSIFTDRELIDQGICPYCWNDLAYYNEYMTYIVDRTKSDIHGPKDQTKAFIEEFVQDNITGIQLKNDQNRHYCPNCKNEFLNPEKADRPGGIDSDTE